MEKMSSRFRRIDDEQKVGSGCMRDGKYINDVHMDQLTFALLSLFLKQDNNKPSR